MDKAPDAFRTISEVAESLETPAHVLRFWESRFPQIKPVKRAGGRRYYRPADVALLSGIRQLLHTEGMTIRGVQKILREQGVRNVAALGGADIDAFDLDAEGGTDEMTVVAIAPEAAAPAVQGRVLPLDRLPRRAPADAMQIMPAEVQALFPSETPLTRQSAEPDALPETTLTAAAEASPDQVAPAATAEPGADAPADTEGGFIAFSNSRSPRFKPRPTAVDDSPPAQATLPFDTEAPEAPHVFVEDDPEPTPPGDVHKLPAAPVEDLVAGLLADELGAALSNHIAEAVAAATLEAQGQDDDPSETATDTADLPGARSEDTAVMDAAFSYWRTTEVGTSQTELDHFELAAPALPDAKLPSTDPSPPDLTDLAPTDKEPTDITLAEVDAAVAEFDGPPVPDFCGLATRLRALSGKVSPQSLADLAELHSRLGLLHAQMAEAVRLRR